MRPYQSNKSYLLYAHPIKGARTGHCAFLVAKENFELSIDNLHLLDDDNVAYYFSMYPDVTPDELRQKPYHVLAALGLPPYTVSSYSQDLIMRGQSRTRCANEEREEINISNLIRTLPERHSEKGEEYFQVGQYDTLVELPPHLNLEKTVACLVEIQQKATWGMFSPLPQHLTRNPNIHNCCSSVRHALRVGGLEIQSPISIARVPEKISLTLWIVYKPINASKR